MPSAAPTEQNANATRAPILASGKDVAAIVALVNNAYRGDSSRRGWTTEEHLLGGQRTDPDAIAHLIGQPGHALLVLRDQSGLCACVLLEAQGPEVCYLGMLTVRPDLQGSGTGRRLLAAAETHAREHFGALYVEMTVIDVRSELIAWYQRRGYYQTGEMRPFPYEDQRFGLPKRSDLRFTVLRRRIADV